MKKSTVILIHSLFWFFYAAILGFASYLFIALDGMLNKNFEFPVNKFIVLLISFFIIPSVANFYSGYVLSFSKTKNRKQVWISLLLLIIIPVVSYLPISIYFGSKILNQSIKSFLEQYILLLIISISLLVLGILIKGFISWFDENKRKNELIQSNQSMELELIKAQLDPHFLFNTLNNIDVLIQKDPEEASNYLNKLSDLMRFMLYETKTETIPLRQEIHFIDQYLDLQKIRSSNENFIQFNVVGDINHHSIPPLLFIPFIENAVKHTLDKSLDGTIQISISAEEKAIQFTCNNKFKKSSSNAVTEGIGNSLIKNRLELTYPNKHQLQVKTKNDTYSVTLSLSNEKV